MSCIVVFNCISKKEIREVKYANGKIKERYQVCKTNKGDQWDGLYQSWYENGQLSAQGNFKKRPLGDTTKGISGIPFGGRIGLWTFWYENGNKASENNYKNGLFNGLQIDWYSNGNKGHEGSFKNDNKEGLHIWWYENGQKKEEAYFSNNLLNGKQTRWYENGNLLDSINNKDNKTNGKFTEYYENGNKKRDGTYIGGNPVGLYTWYYENGNKSEESNFLNGRYNGSQVKWFENGNMMLQASYINGTMNGTYTEWYNNGVVKESGTILSGIRDGIWKTFSINGKPKEITYIKGYPKSVYIHILDSNSVKWKYRDFYAKKIQIGDLIKITGKVANVTPNGANISTELTYFGYLGNQFWLNYDKDKYTILADDIVTIWGKYSGLATMISGLNSDIKSEQPELQLVYMVNQSE